MRPLPMMPLVSHKSREPPHNLAPPPLDFFKVADLPPPPPKKLVQTYSLWEGGGWPSTERPSCNKDCLSKISTYPIQESKLKISLSEKKM